MARFAMTRGLKLAVPVLAALALAGCTLFPRKADLETIHDAYRSEFASTFLGAVERGADTCRRGQAGTADGFPRTLLAIRDFEIKYRDGLEGTAEHRHLVVLKAMIHLQVGNTGIADTMVGDVEKAQITSGEDRATRDELFRRAFRHLVAGWKAICDASLPAEARIARTLDAGDKVIAVANEAAKEAAGRPATDEGGVYLATTGAIFRSHAYEAANARCDRSVDVSLATAEQQRICACEAGKVASPATGADAIRQFLSEEERKAAGASDAASWLRVVPRGRVHYVQWYAFLSSEAQKAAKACGAR